jgi:membrane protein
MRSIAAVFRDAYRRFDDDDGWAIASHIALSAVMSMFPFLIFVTAVASFLGTEKIADQAAEMLFDAWPKEVAGPIAAEIHRVLTRPRGGLLTIGALLYIHFSARGVEALRVALDRAYDLDDRRPWWLLRIEAVLFVLLGAFGLLAFAFLVVLAPLAWAFAERLAPPLAHALSPLFAPVRFGVTTLILLFVLTVCHKYLPAGRRSLRMIAPGVLLTLVAWIGFGAAFGAYLANFAGNYVSTYAGLASIMIALIFLNALGAIFIFGAELNQAVALAPRREPPPGLIDP